GARTVDVEAVSRSEVARPQPSPGRRVAASPSPKILQRPGDVGGDDRRGSGDASRLCSIVAGDPGIAMTYASISPIRPLRPRARALLPLAALVALAGPGCTDGGNETQGSESASSSSTTDAETTGSSTTAA